MNLFLFLLASGRAFPVDSRRSSKIKTRRKLAGSVAAILGALNRRQFTELRARDQSIRHLEIGMVR